MFRLIHTYNVLRWGVENRFPLRPVSRTRFVVSVVDRFGPLAHTIETHTDVFHEEELVLYTRPHNSLGRLVGKDAPDFEPANGAKVDVRPGPT